MNLLPRCSVHCSRLASSTRVISRRCLRLRRNRNWRPSCAESLVGKHFIRAQGSYVYPEQLMNRTKYNICRRDIRFSTHPSVVLISYIILTEIEVGDIITIVGRGSRYRLPPEDIKSMLTVVDF